MFKFIARALVLLFAATLTVLMATDNSLNRTVEANNLAADPNPLLAEWAGPYGGIPPFDKVQIALFKPGRDNTHRLQVLPLYLRISRINLYSCQ